MDYKTKGRLVLKTEKEVRIFTDPYRMRITEIFFKERRALTPKQVADILGELPSKVNYHIKKLASINVLYVTRTEDIKGITAKFYGLTHGSFALDSEHKTDEYYVPAVKKLVESDLKIHLDWFMKDLIESKEKFGTVDPADFELGNSYFRICASKDDVQKIEKELNAVFSKYGELDENKNIYRVFIGYVKTEDGKNK